MHAPGVYSQVVYKGKNLNLILKLNTVGYHVFGAAPSSGVRSFNQTRLQLYSDSVSGAHSASR